MKQIFWVDKCNDANCTYLNFFCDFWDTSYLVWQSLARLEVIFSEFWCRKFNEKNHLVFYYAKRWGNHLTYHYNLQYDVCNGSIAIFVSVGLWIASCKCLESNLKDQKVVALSGYELMGFYFFLLFRILFLYIFCIFKS